MTIAKGFFFFWTCLEEMEMQPYGLVRNQTMEGRNHVYV